MRGRQPSPWAWSDVAALRRSAVAVRVPATSANLGPGFDSLGLALTLHDDLVAMASDDPGVVVEVAGEGAGEVPLDARHLVVRSMQIAFEQMQVLPAGFVLRCHNAIPHGRGLGSSAAAIVGGMVLARAMVEGGGDLLDDEAILAAATALEGHPDNVAAALHGGFTIAWGSGDVGAVRRDVHPDVVPVVFIPSVTVQTATARGLLPATVAHSAAAFNVARTALLVYALTEDPGCLLEATDDRLHQEHRAAAYPETFALVQRLRATGIPAAVSGSGPTVLALCDGRSTVLAGSMAPAGWRVAALEVAARGAHVVDG